MSALEGNRVGYIAMEDPTWGNREMEEGGRSRKGSSNNGEEARECRLRVEGGCRLKGVSAGRRALQWLVLLLSCTAGGTDLGGSWKRQAPGGEEGSWGNSKGSACWGGGSWLQARGAVTGDSWQNAPTGGSGGSSGDAGAESGHGVGSAAYCTQAGLGQVAVGRNNCQ